MVPLIAATLDFQEGWLVEPMRRLDDEIIDPFHERTVIPARSVSKYEDDSEGLTEYAPIHSSILQSEIQYYSFSVNSSTGLGEYYEYLVFMTGNICLQPDNLNSSDNDSLVVYYSFNSLILTNLEDSLMGKFEYGYFQALAEVSVSSTSSVLYIVVQAPQSTNLTDTWSYEIGVSQNDLVHQWDSRLFVEIVDTDDHSALIVTGNLTLISSNHNVSQYNSSLSNYELLVFQNEHIDYFATLNESWCAVRNGPSLMLTGDYVTSYTTRGGSLRQQFYVPGLNSSTQYIGYLLYDSNDLTGSPHGGVLYSHFEFETMSDDACALVYDLDFCDEVAYSVPALSVAEYNSADALKTLYDDQARSLFSNFSKGLQQIACNTTKDAIFTPLGSCETCSELYKNWLCSVTIPRCSTRNITGYLHREANASRSTFIDETVIPVTDYYEVLPCVNVCQIMTRDCPAEFGFACPQSNASIKLSYYWDDGGDYATCNFVGDCSAVTSSAFIVQVAWKLLLVSIAFITMSV
ncbi:hypothetical protein METBIDRAFT_33405 [Metschnikowia bicuspidata var. bicuspidata NRRL YB-4993]|uniref:FZ domain-containing protein n=1 Tax=Metschnikowia bicuspidata var. bicuspidata NRRL YB-4993 TaxID=869754 RepID=A0A1A0H5J9_9ASCO|nr:hypothetical protein METBIDRAFT_33405 [Metschnikowia bicuspidata var. bicuspidata NRRL YB-4993]OBA19193.1 hypothetical protein METBIDRAFT_33405 [Metschnikowia bicuspidata var. bicuspidata NRRL YB-4993]